MNAKQLIENADAIVKDAWFMDNAGLPEEFHNHRDGGRTLADLERICDKRDKPTAEQVKKERWSRAEQYRKSLEETGEIQYQDIDEDSQYRYQQAFAKYCPEINLEDE